MHIMIAGGGKVGYYLTKTLLAARHSVSLIELSTDNCRVIADELNIPVFNGDATRIDLLKEVQQQFKSADVFIAVTGQDEENLIACQLAKKNLGIQKTIARVNNPKNINVFKMLGVDRAVSSTSVIADLIEEEVDYAGLKILTDVKDYDIVMTEIPVGTTSPVRNCRVGDVKMPAPGQLVLVIRKHAIMQPNDDIVLMEGDSVIVVSDTQGIANLMKLFIGKAAEAR